MKIRQLKQLFAMFPDDMEIMVQTVPEDFLQPLEQKHIRITEASYEEKYKELHPSRFCITAFVDKSSKGSEHGTWTLRILQ